MMTLDMDINYPFIPTVAAAWGVKHATPIVVRLHVSPSLYTSSMQPPKVDILQLGQKYVTFISLIDLTFISIQLRSINTAYIYYKQFL